MERHFDTELSKLKGLVRDMADFVEKAIEESMGALLERQPARCKKVHEYEDRINQLHIEVDEFCVELIARQAPRATDLRKVLSMVKVNTDLERMGDQAVNIALNAEHYLSHPPFKELVDLPKMADEVRAMVRDAREALLSEDEGLARKVIERDDTVDHFKDQIFHDITAKITTMPDMALGGVELILITRNMERLGDHATNIAEDVIFFMSGRDIRHGQENQNPAQ